MKRILTVKRLYLVPAVLCVMALTSPAWATFTLVQHVTGTSTSSSSITSLAVTVSSTGAGNVIVVVLGSEASKAITGITCSPNACSGANAFVHCSSCVGAYTTAASTDIYYTLNSKSGDTTLTLAFPGVLGVDMGVDIFEYSFSGTSVAIDSGSPNGGNVDNSTNTLRGGVPLSISGTNDLIVQGLFLSASSTACSAVTSPYSTTADFYTSDAGSGIAHGCFAAAANITSGTAPTWTFAANSFSAGSALAIAETSLGQAANIQVTPTGTSRGACTGAGGVSILTPAQFNTSSNWGTGPGQIGPDTQILVCGTFAGTAGGSMLSFQGGGTNGHPIVMKFDTGVVFTSPVWGYGSNNLGAIIDIGFSYIQLYAGATITNTCNGSVHLATCTTGTDYHTSSSAITISGASNVTVSGVTISNLCVVTTSQTCVDGSTNWDAAIYLGGAHDNITVQESTIHDTNTAIYDNCGLTTVLDTFSKNTISNVNWGIAAGGNGTGTALCDQETASYNDISSFSNWDASGDHHDGIFFYTNTGTTPFTNAQIYGNKFHGDIGSAATAFIFTQANGGALTGLQIYNNLIVQGRSVDYNGNALISTGSGATVANNTIDCNSVGANGAIEFNADTGSSGGTVKNNIIQNCEIAVNYASGTVSASDYNVWYNITQTGNGGGNGIAIYPAGCNHTCNTIAAWRTGTSLDAHTVITNPNLTVGYTLGLSSSALAAGVNLTSLSIANLDIGAPQTFGAAYACGIGCLSRPASGAWDIGAYPGAITVTIATPQPCGGGHIYAVGAVFPCNIISSASDFPLVSSQGNYAPANTYLLTNPIFTAPSQLISWGDTTGSGNAGLHIDTGTTGPNFSFTGLDSALNVNIIPNKGRFNLLMQPAALGVGGSVNTSTPIYIYLQSYADSVYLHYATGLTVIPTWYICVNGTCPGTGNYWQVTATTTTGFNSACVLLGTTTFPSSPTVGQTATDGCATFSYVGLHAPPQDAAFSSTYAGHGYSLTVASGSQSGTTGTVVVSTNPPMWKAGDLVTVVFPSDTRLSCTNCAVVGTPTSTNLSYTLAASLVINSETCTGATCGISGAHAANINNPNATATLLSTGLAVCYELPCTTALENMITRVLEHYSANCNATYEPPCSGNSGANGPAFDNIIGYIRFGLQHGGENVVDYPQVWQTFGIPSNFKPYYLSWVKIVDAFENANNPGNQVLMTNMYNTMNPGGTTTISPNSALTTSGFATGCSNPANAYDSNLTTFATCYDDDFNRSPQGTTWTSFGSGVSNPSSLTLRVTSQVAVVGVGSVTASLQYSLNAGSTWTTIYSVNNPGRSLTTDSVTLSTSQNLSLLQVRASCAWVSGTPTQCNQGIYEIQVAENFGGSGPDPDFSDYEATYGVQNNMGLDQNGLQGSVLTHVGDPPNCATVAPDNAVPGDVAYNFCKYCGAASVGVPKYTMPNGRSPVCTVQTASCSTPGQMTGSVGSCTSGSLSPVAPSSGILNWSKAIGATNAEIYTADLLQGLDLTPTGGQCPQCLTAQQIPYSSTFTSWLGQWGDFSGGIISGAWFDFGIGTVAACGPPNYCSRTDLIAQPYPAPLPPPCASPVSGGCLLGANYEFIPEPAFGTPNIRLTDYASCTGCSGGSHSWEGSLGSSEINSFNTLNNRLSVTEVGNWQRMIALSGTGTSITGTFFTAFVSPGTGEMDASYVQPYIYYHLHDCISTSGCAATGDLAIFSYDFTCAGGISTCNPPPTLVVDITSTCSLPGVTFSPEGVTVSGDDQTFGVDGSTTTGQGTSGDVYEIAWNRTNGCSYWNSGTGQVYTNGALVGTVGISDKFTIHNLRIAKSGNFIRTALEECISTCTPANEQYFWVPFTTTANVSYSGSNPNGCGHNALGYTHAVNKCNGSVDVNGYFIAPMSAPNSLVSLPAAYPSPESPNVNHINWNDDNPSDTAVFASIHYTYGFTFGVTYAWDNELILVQTSSPGSGLVYRIGHTFTSVDEFTSVMLSQDGTLMAYTSDWGGLLGCTDDVTQVCVSGPPPQTLVNYAVNDIVWPATSANAGGYLFQVSAYCETGTPLPASWNQTVGGTQTFGTCTFTNINKPTGNGAPRTDVFLAILH